MVKETRNTRSSDDPRPSREDWGHLLSVGSVVAAVLFVLILGAALRVEPTEADPAASANAEPEPWVARELRRPDPRDDPGPRPPDPAPDPVPQDAADPDAVPQDAVSDPPRPGPGADPLAARAVADVRRLAATGQPWTAQVAVLCDRDRVESQLARFGDDDRFHVLPVALDGRACFRFCWGSFGDPGRARAAAGLPSELRGLSAQPIPKRTAEVVR